MFIIGRVKGKGDQNKQSQTKRDNQNNRPSTVTKLYEASKNNASKSDYKSQVNESQQKQAQVSVWPKSSNTSQSAASNQPIPALPQPKPQQPLASAWIKTLNTSQSPVNSETTTSTAKATTAITTSPSETPSDIAAPAKTSQSPAIQLPATSLWGKLKQTDVKTAGDVVNTLPEHQTVENKTSLNLSPSNASNSVSIVKEAITASTIENKSDDAINTVDEPSEPLQMGNLNFFKK